MGGTTTLFVFCYLPGATTGVPAGRFEHDAETGVGRFQYGRRYQQRANAIPVDCASLPLAGPIAPVDTNGGLYGAFRDASPDYWGRLVIASRMRCPIEALTEIDYLVEANATRVGNLDFRDSLDAPEPELAPPQFNDLGDLLEAAAEFERGDVVDERIRLLFEQGSSLGGARPKCTVESDGKLWLAKFPSRNDPISIPRLEHATMKLAQVIGLDVPEIQLVSCRRRDVFLTRRFDREHVGNGWSRRGFLSALSLAEWDERDRHRWSYRTITERIRKFSVRPQADLHELFRRVAFNILVRNTDDHPRNHGFLAERDGLILSPLFDVVPALAHRGVGSDFFLAMGVGERGRLASLDNLCSMSGAFNLGSVQAEEVTREMHERIRRTWRDRFAEAGFAGRELELLAPSFP